MKIVTVALLLLLPGCASLFQPNYGQMSADQIAAASKDKSAVVVCTRLIAPGYTLETVSISLDQNSIKDGGVSGDGSNGCVAAINSMAPPKSIRTQTTTPVKPPAP